MEKLVSVACYDKNINIANEGRGALNGLLYLIGISLCFTGIGAFVGVPLIIIVFIYQVKGNERIIGAWKGSCPKCGGDIFWYAGNEETKQGNFQCPICNISIDFYDSKFIHEEKFN
ncbi:MAG: hypothetical protein V7683_09735 [Pseudoalteromonas distincta]